jgi:hypothetical protein
MSIEIKGVTKDETAYDKWIHFTHEGVEYHAQLHWDKYDGFDLHFTDATRSANWIDDPEWSIMWEAEDGESLEFILDSLTDEVIEASY